jgi:hypothetical protein
MIYSKISEGMLSLYFGLDVFCLFGARVSEFDTQPLPSPHGFGKYSVHCTLNTASNGRFLSGGIILGSPLSCTDLFLYTITLPADSCDAPPTLSDTTLKSASRELLLSKKPALILEPGSKDDKSALGPFHPGGYPYGRFLRRLDEYS